MREGARTLTDKGKVAVDEPRALEDGSVVGFGNVEMIYCRAPELLATETTF